MKLYYYSEEVENDDAARNLHATFFKSNFSRIAHAKKPTTCVDSFFK